MKKLNLQESADDYTLIEKAIHYLEENQRNQPTLKEIAESVNLSEYHFQRLFTRWVGISPKRFLQFLTKENAKRILAKSNLFDAAYETGLSSTGRLHDLLVHTEALTPGDLKRKGAGLKIRYGTHPTPFGQAFIATTERGICKLSFDAKDALHSLKSDLEDAVLIQDSAHTQILIEKIFSPKKSETPLTLHLRGTNFQIQVWEALLRIPTGDLVAYNDIATAIDSPKATRAVGSAVGKNPVPFLIPCHRVIRATGEFGKYAFGNARKKAILGYEMAQAGA
ncbi:MAG: methylated-DNA--[protein]-cysteine S-methyltransferase [Anaerolineae bacterium]|jgi:AraC family transcriptional regulator of adaptative response/methylated-DNA-[protein]-cysteine methyltransferase|nr:methylated-DNA--[protein]-cysteine S-methyltransferase [Anaerolineae bacterium]MBT4310355.1 methylated-DNA--[protein]-cysteine S-methyltransferase [Anaerolineae bacterium]MBT4458870.1 methylated-DNA--[protein]-cysteine S-methyltransferase [Anaerolineae bacterium]MBT4842529.1 methylated-DNA--[protein]-cysteine S-methyltransferase [Anaerolineae bacterium]MBT6062182.1 methylated-DNA--[protein]-cysteine S-methyltransferase [Anaerolineae bacterium]